MSGEEFLSSDQLQHIAFFIDDPKNFIQFNLVCSKFRDAGEKIKYVKGEHFSTYREHSQETVRDNSEERFYELKKLNYFSLPNERLHGESVTKTYKRKLYGSFGEPQITKRRFAFGSLISEETE